MAQADPGLVLWTRAREGHVRRAIAAQVGDSWILSVLEDDLVVWVQKHASPRGLLEKANRMRQRHDSEGWALPSPERRTAAAKGRTILLIDDHEDSRELVEITLTIEGFRVVTADNGRAGMEALRAVHAADAHEPCAIVLDLMMPESSGWDFRRMQLADPALAPIPLVIVSGATRDMERVYDLKPHAAFIKPIDPLEVGAVVSEICRK